MGRSFNLDEVSGLSETSPERNKLGFKMVQAEEALFRADREGHFRATQIAYPILYGPRQPGAHDWSILRRVLDGRRPFVIADGGIKLEARCFAANAAHAVLLAIDQPAVSAGQKYLVADDQLYSMRQRIEAFARIMGHEFEFIDMPWELARPCHVLWRRMRECRFRDTRKIRYELGYSDVVDAYEALRQSVSWLLEERPQPGGELETQLGDPFDYASEDALIGQWQALRAQMPEVDYHLPPPAHIYRHPDKVNDDWCRPA
jgi:nucleoside-diphosphate-sugar epimerase